MSAPSGLARSQVNDLCVSCLVAVQAGSLDSKLPIPDSTVLYNPSLPHTLDDDQLAPNLQ